MTNLTTFRHTDNVITSLRNGSCTYSISNASSIQPKRNYTPSTGVCNLCEESKSVILSNNRYNNREQGYDNNGSIMSYDQNTAMEFNNVSMPHHPNFQPQSSQLSNIPHTRHVFNQNQNGGQLMQGKPHLYHEDEEKNYAERYKQHQHFVKEKPFTSENNAKMLVNNGQCSTAIDNNTQTPNSSYPCNSNNHHSTMPLPFHSNRNVASSIMTGKHIFNYTR